MRRSSCVFAVMPGRFYVVLAVLVSVIMMFVVFPGGTPLAVMGKALVAVLVGLLAGAAWVRFVVDRS